jgi:uncharacterized OsmC-like protein
VSSGAASIGQSIVRVREYLAAHPEEARSADSEARAVLGSGLRVSVEGPKGWRVETDMATAVGGDGSAPSPGWLMRAALASCDATLIRMQCAEEGVTVNSLEAVVSSESDDRGLVGSVDDVPAGPLSVQTTVRISAQGLDRPALTDLIERAIKKSPVADALRREIPVSVEIAD